MTFKQFEDKIRRFNERWISYVVDYIPVNADILSVMSLFLTTVVVWLLVEDRLLSAGVLFLIASSFDMLDGAFARVRGTARPFGAFLDSVVDRYSEMLVLLGLLVNVLMYHSVLKTALIIAIFMSLYGSVITSYIRARAESLGFNGKAGIVDRPIRVIIISLGLMLNMIDQFIFLLAVLANISALQRFFSVWMQSKYDKQPKE